MTDLEERIKIAEKRVPSQMKTANWRRSVSKSDREAAEMLKKLCLDSKVDPRELDEPATL